jgi:rubrerythrin
MSPRTKKNLLTAMECDAFDAAKYSRFAAHARMDDDWQLAKAFQDTADLDRVDHFAKEAELEGLLSSSPDNLRNAIDEETKGRNLLAQFAQEAREDGDLSIAAALEAISRDKAERCARFEAILAEMGLRSNPHTVDA